VGASGPGQLPRAVLDTSALFSEHRHWLWLLAHQGYFEAVWSTFIVGELVRIRVEHSIRRGVERAIYRQRINELIHLLSDVMVVADYRRATTTGMLPDPDDEPILATALAAGASYAVSLNTRDFPPGRTAAGVMFVTPHDFLQVLDSLYPSAPPSRRSGGIGRLLP
jgi:predicted nucleic acid-binding protein